MHPRPESLESADRRSGRSWHRYWPKAHRPMRCTGRGLRWSRAVRSTGPISLETGAVIAVQPAFRSGPDVAGVVLSQRQHDHVLEPFGRSVNAKTVLLSDGGKRKCQSKHPGCTETPTPHHQSHCPYPNRHRSVSKHEIRRGPASQLHPRGWPFSGAIGVLGRPTPDAEDLQDPRTSSAKLEDKIRTYCHSRDNAHQQRQQLFRIQEGAIYEDGFGPQGAMLALVTLCLDCRLTRSYPLHSRL